MEDIGLVKQGWKWLRSQKDACSRARVAVGCCKDRVCSFLERHWPKVCSGSVSFVRLLRCSVLLWKNCVVRGFRSMIAFGSAALLFIMWSFFLSLTSLSCLAYVILSMGAAGVAIKYLGYTPGIFIVGLFAILVLWMYANFWIMGTLFVVGGYLFSLNHARLVVLVAAIYASYCVKVQVGWHGVFLSINLAFLSSDLLNFMLQWCDKMSESTHSEEQKPSARVLGDEFSEECEYFIPTTESENLHSCKSSSTPPVTSSVTNEHKESASSKTVKELASSVDEMKRILNCVDHYEALGFPRHKTIDAKILKQEYRKKAMLVHPDKNMGSSQASESFKKLQCAYEVLSDSIKKRDYDEQLRKEESRTRSVCQRSHSTSHQGNQDYRSEESRRIQCTKCGLSHIWVCTNRSKAKARWCQDCCQYHQAKDGDGWVEYRGSLVFGCPQRWKYHVLLSVLRAKSLMYQNGLSAREWLVGPTLISLASMEGRKCLLTPAIDPSGSLGSKAASVSLEAGEGQGSPPKAPPSANTSSRGQSRPRILQRQGIATKKWSKVLTCLQ